jgi:hypothetical protein
VPLQGCSHLLFAELQVVVISTMLVRVIVTVPKFCTFPGVVQRKDKFVGAVELLPQFSEVPHLGDCPKT